MPEPGTGLLIVTAAAPTNAVEASHPSSRSTAGIERQVNIHGGGQHPLRTGRAGFPRTTAQASREGVAGGDTGFLRLRAWSPR